VEEIWSLSSPYRSPVAAGNLDTNNEMEPRSTSQSPSRAQNAILVIEDKESAVKVFEGFVSTSRSAIPRNQGRSPARTSGRGSYDDSEGAEGSSKPRRG
jgi:hypothetical protein